MWNAVLPLYSSKKRFANVYKHIISLVISVLRKLKLWARQAKRNKTKHNNKTTIHLRNKCVVAIYIFQTAKTESTATTTKYHHQPIHSEKFVRGLNQQHFRIRQSINLNVWLSKMNLMVIKRNGIRFFLSFDSSFFIKHLFAKSSQLFATYTF